MRSYVSMWIGFVQILVLCMSGTVSAGILEDTKSVTIKDESGTFVSLLLSESLDNAQCERRVYGTPSGVLNMFDTLYHEDRRIESYEAAIREMCMQPGGEGYGVSDLINTSIGVSDELRGEVQGAMELVDKCAKNINKQYVKGGTAQADFHNDLAHLGRKLNKLSKDPSFSKSLKTLQLAGVAIEEIRATKTLSDVVVGSVMLNALYTDQAIARLYELKSIVEQAQQAGERVDPALLKAIGQAEINIRASQSKIGAFAVQLNDDLQKVTDAAVSLGGTMIQVAAKFNPVVAMWVGAPMMTYSTLRGISDQWEMAQDATTMATLTSIVDRNGSSNLSGNMAVYGQISFYGTMEATFSVGGAKWKDFLTIGHVNKDLADYYGQQKSWYEKEREENSTMSSIGGSDPANNGSGSSDAGSGSDSSVSSGANQSPGNSDGGDERPGSRYVLRVGEVYKPRDYQKTFYQD